MLEQRYGKNIGHVDPSRIVSDLLSSVGFQAMLLPADRRVWIASFLETACRHATYQQGTDRDPALGRERWASTVPGMLREGVISYFVGIIGTALNPDGKDIVRGHAWGCREELELYSTGHISEILDDAIRTSDIEVWRQYSNWFIRGGAALDRWRHVRASAARWLPAFTPLNLVDLTLLRDADPEVRRFTAMNAAMYQPKSVDSRVVKELSEAIQDRTWIWSADDYFSFEWSGCHSAAELLLKLNVAEPNALRQISALIEEDDEQRGALASSGQLESNPWVLARLKRLNAALNVR